MNIALSRSNLTLACSALALVLSCGGSRPNYTPEGTGGGGSGGSENGGSSSAGASGGGAAGATAVEIFAQADSAYEGAADETVSFTPDFDWNGIIGTGQSLSVGTTPVTSTTQPYNNLMLSLGELGNLGVPPWEPESEQLSMVPLVEPVRPLATGFPAPYPRNIGGETPHSCMANQVSAMSLYYGNQDYVTVHSVVGESGQGMVALKKPDTQWVTTTSTTIGRAYDASMYEVTAIQRLADASGKSYGVSAVIMTHGETDCNSSTYKDELIQLQTDYDTDIKAITGQKTDIPMFLSQQFAYPSNAGSRPIATQTQWQLAVEMPERFVCVGPKYQYPGATKKDGVHLNADGYRLLGEKIGQVYYERIVLGNDWRPLEPESVTRSGKVITVNFHVPVPPLVWDENLPEPPLFPNGRGFEVRSGTTKLAIESVGIDGNSVKITCSETLPSTALTVGYAISAQTDQMEVASYAYRWGQLKDSDPFVGASTLRIQPNYAVAFEWTLDAE